MYSIYTLQELEAYLALETKDNPVNDSDSVVIKCGRWIKIIPYTQYISSLHIVNSYKLLYRGRYKRCKTAFKRWAQLRGKINTELQCA